jgi:hypothetical protein
VGADSVDYPQTAIQVSSDPTYSPHLFKRLPIVSSFILIFIAMLTLALMGYQSGLNGAIVLIPRFALILSLSTVMIVIADLDRPDGELIGLSQHAMIELQKQINTDIE